MTIKRFDAITHEQVRYCLEVLAIKGNEYAPSGDRLAHFKHTAALMGTVPKNALYRMMAKHLTCLYQMCFCDYSSMAQWKEKITDSINYLLLLWAMVLEEGCDADGAGGAE